MTRVMADASGDKVTGIEYVDRDGEKQVQPASVVVLAAWAAQNPRLLLNSATGKHDKGLANRNGLVGKYLMTHFASGTNALFDEDVETVMGTIGAQYLSCDRYGKTAHEGAFGSTTSSPASPPSLPASAALPTRGPTCSVRRCMRS